MTLLPWRAGLAGAEPSDTVGGTLAAIAVLHLHLVGRANLAVGVHVFLLLLAAIAAGIGLLGGSGLHLGIVTLLLGYAELARAGYQLAVRRTPACVAVHLEIASRVAHLAILQCQSSSNQHRRN